MDIHNHRVYALLAFHTLCKDKHFTVHWYSAIEPVMQVKQVWHWHWYTIMSYTIIAAPLFVNNFK